MPTETPPDAVETPPTNRGHSDHEVAREIAPDDRHLGPPPRPTGGPRAIRLAIWALKLGLGGVFLYAGSTKLLDPHSFATEVAGYQLLPELAPLVATMLPPTEVILALALWAAPLRSDWLKAAALATTLVFSVFLVAVIQVVVRGIDTRCGCFGGSSGVVDHLAIARVSALLLASGLLFALTQRLDRGSSAGRSRG